MTVRDGLGRLMLGMGLASATILVAAGRPLAGMIMCLVAALLAVTADMSVDDGMPVTILGVIAAALLGLILIRHGTGLTMLMILGLLFTLVAVWGLLPRLGGAYVHEH